MDDKDSLFTISHNNDNNNVSDTETLEEVSSIVKRVEV